jgi:hypothetical protein
MTQTEIETFLADFSEEDAEEMTSEAIEYLAPVVRLAEKILADTRREEDELVGMYL